MSKNITVVVFKITPYDKSIENYVNNLEISHVYALFGNKDALMRPDILTASIPRIVDYERYIGTLLLSPNNMASTQYPWLLQEAQRICPTVSIMFGDFNYFNPKTVWTSLVDVYDRDEQLFNTNLSKSEALPTIFVLTADGIYIGHIYAWKVSIAPAIPNGQITNVIGIRSSILEILAAKCGQKQANIANILLSAIRTWALISSGPQYIRIIQPIGSMPLILEKCGFTKVEQMQNIPDWLIEEPFLGETDIYNWREMMYFDETPRHRDYVTDAHKQLQCHIPPHKIIFI